MHREAGEESYVLLFDAPIAIYSFMPVDSLINIIFGSLVFETTMMTEGRHLARMPMLPIATRWNIVGPCQRRGVGRFRHRHRHRHRRCRRCPPNPLSIHGRLAPGLRPNMHVARADAAWRAHNGPGTSANNLAFTNCQRQHRVTVRTVLLHLHTAVTIVVTACSAGVERMAMGLSEREGQ